MEKKIVATPIPPDQPEAPRLIVRIAGVCLVVGVFAMVGGSFWPVLPVLGLLLIIGAMLLIAAVILLAPYWRPPDRLDRHEKRDIRKLYGDQ